MGRTTRYAFRDPGEGTTFHLLADICSLSEILVMGSGESGGSWSWFKGLQIENEMTLDQIHLIFVSGDQTSMLCDDGFGQLPYGVRYRTEPGPRTNSAREESKVPYPWTRTRQNAEHSTSNHIPDIFWIYGADEHHRGGPP